MEYCTYCTGTKCLSYTSGTNIQRMSAKTETMSKCTQRTKYSFAASDLVLHCLPMSHTNEVRLIWVNPYSVRAIG